MPKEMFGDVVDPSIKVGTKKWYTVPLSILAHAIGLGALIIVPLMATGNMPTPPSMMAFVAAAPPPPPPPPPPPTAPVRVGGKIAQPQKRHDVKPVYPPIAQSARVQGIVIIEATIGPDGSVKDAKVLRGQPLLNEAALEAVRQWKYTPTLLNGVPVPVIMTVTVTFTLQ